MKKLCRLVKSELDGWKLWEILYVTICTLAITVISVILGDNWLGIASALTGTLYTMFAGKGKISCYFFGIFNSATYGWISFENRIYGDATLNWAWYLPMMFVGIACWHRKMNSDSCVIKTHLNNLSRLFFGIGCAVAIIIYALILQKLNDSQPLIDSTTTVLSVAAMILTVKRCVEQWLMWILVNGISVYMWLRVYLSDGSNAATLMWWLIMFVTGIIFFIQWSLEINRQKKSVDLQKIGG